MSLMELLKRVTDTQRDLQIDRRKAYRQLVGQIADGQEPDAGKVAGILEGAGKTVDALAADVEALLKRRELSSAANRIPELERKLAAVKKKIDAALEAFSKIEEKHVEEIDKLDFERKTLNDNLRSSEAAKQRLMKTVTDEDLLAKKAELEEAFTAKHNELSAARNQLEDRKRLSLNNFHMTRNNEQQQADEVAKWERRIAETTALIPKLEKELEAIEAEQAKFNRQLLEP